MKFIFLLMFAISIISPCFSNPDMFEEIFAQRSNLGYRQPREENYMETVLNNGNGINLSKRHSDKKYHPIQMLAEHHNNDNNLNDFAYQKELKFRRRRHDTSKTRKNGKEASRNLLRNNPYFEQRGPFFGHPYQRKGNYYYKAQSKGLKKGEAKKHYHY